MKRHDTHLLSDESEKEDREEDAHKYIFNSSKNSSKNSEEKYISKDSKENITILKKYLNKNKLEKNDSIISSTELENIFGNDINNKKIKKKKNKKNKKYFIKLKKVKINKENNKEETDYCFTYNPSLRNIIIDKKIKNDCYKNISRNCISLNNSFNNKISHKNELKKEKKEKEILYYFHNDNIEGNRKLKNFIKILNDDKLKLLKISNNNNFSINSQFPFLYKNNFYCNNYEYEMGFQNYYNRSKYYLSPNNIKNKNNFFLNKNGKIILKSNSSSNNSINIQKYPNQKKSFKSKKTKRKILDKIEMLYNVYVGNDNKKLKQIKSNDSHFEYPDKRKIWNKRVKNKKYLNLFKEKNHVGFINNMIRIQARDINNYCCYNKHFGNNDNCPICQSIEHKNEETIQKLGISRMTPNISNEKTNNSWKKRRVYSALTKILSKKGNKNNNKFELIYDNLNSNMSRCLSISKNKSRKNNSNLFDLKKTFVNRSCKKSLTNNKNNNFRKLNINKSISLQNNYSTYNRFCKSKSQSIKSN